MICEETAKTYCYEDLSLIENYDKAIADTTQTWECHHILGEQYSKKYLKENGLYENRPACEFRFMTRLDHTRLHKRGVPLSAERKRKIANAQKGIPRGPMREEHKKAIGKALINSPKKSKAVLQFTKSGEFIREWQSMNEAERQLGISCSHICRCCTGKLKSAGGYIWKYA